MAVSDRPINKDKFFVERRLIEIRAALRDLRVAIPEASSPETKAILQRYAQDLRREQECLRPILKQLKATDR